MNRRCAKLWWVKLFSLNWNALSESPFFQHQHQNTKVVTSTFSIDMLCICIYECKVSSLNSLNEARSFLFSKLLPYHQPSIMHCQLINTLYINYLSFVKNQLPTNFKIFTLYKNFMQLCCVNMCVCVSVLLMQQGLFDRKLLVRKLPSAYDVEERQRKLYENHFISPHTTRIWMVASKQRKG